MTDESAEKLQDQQQDIEDENTDDMQDQSAEDTEAADAPDPAEQKPAPENASQDAADAEEDDDDADDDQQEQGPSVLYSGEFEADFDSVVEAVLFATDEPITPNRLVNIIETGSIKQVRAAIKRLNEKYEAGGHSFRIEKIAGGHQMMTLGPYHHWLRNMIKTRSESRLTQAALETLAIIAYKQPIIRADVEAIRGVAAGEMIRSLMYKGLVKITGRADVLGRPMLYGTTKKFLDVFGLNSLKDLPKIEELKKPEK